MVCYVVFLVAVGPFTLAALENIVGKIFSGSGGSAFEGEVYLVALVFIFSPLLLLVLVIRAIVAQHNEVRILNALLWCTLAATLFVIGSWGMHSFKEFSVLLSLSSVMFSALGFGRLSRVNRKNG